MLKFVLWTINVYNVVRFTKENWKNLSKPHLGANCPPVALVQMVKLDIPLSWKHYSTVSTICIATGPSTIMPMQQKYIKCITDAIVYNTKSIYVELFATHYEKKRVTELQTCKKRMLTAHSFTA